MDVHHLDLVWVELWSWKNDVSNNCTTDEYDSLRMIAIDGGYRGGVEGSKSMIN